MLDTKNCPNAYKEVYVILKSMNEKDFNLIPKDIIQMIEKNMNKEYHFEINENTDFEKIELLRETKAILAYIFMHYWATDEQRKKVNRKFLQDILKG